MQFHKLAQNTAQFHTLQRQCSTSTASVIYGSKERSRKIGNLANKEFTDSHTIATIFRKESYYPRLLKIYDTDDIGLCGDPIWVRTLSNLFTNTKNHVNGNAIDNGNGNTIAGDHASEFLSSMVCSSRLVDDTLLPNPWRMTFYKQTLR